MELFRTLKAVNGKAVYPADAIEFATLNVTYGLLFGDRLNEGDNDEKFIISSSQKMIESFTPVLLAFPLAIHLPHFKKLMYDLKPIGRDVIDFFRRKIQESLEKVGSHENFVKDFIEKIGSDYDENELVFVLRDLILAGGETTSNTTCWALVYLANNLEVQERVRKEIDSVVPRGRLPSLSDKPNLPFTEAVLLEVMRIRTLAPFSMPHATRCETEVAGYKVPANTMVLVNLWSAHMDPNTWSEPEQFRPERFYDEETGTVIKRDHVMSFSCGKRACLGEVLARQEVWLLFTAFFHNFTVLPPDGCTSISTDMIVGGTLRPVPFHVRLIPRE